MPQRSRESYLLSSVWAPWEQLVPDWTAASSDPSIGNGSVIGACRRNGTTGHYRGVIQMGTLTTYGTGEWRVALPDGWSAATSITTGFQVGNILMVPTAGSAYSGFCWAAAGATVLRMVTNASVPASVTSASPASWTASASNFLTWNITLELDNG